MRMGPLSCRKSRVPLYTSYSAHFGTFYSYLEAQCLLQSFIRPVMDYYIQTFAKFGPPKEILVVRGADGAYSQHSLSITGWKSIRIIHGIQSVDLPAWAVDRLVEYTFSFLEVYKATNPWLQWRMPTLRIVGVKLEGEVVMWKNQDPKALLVGRRLARVWKEMTSGLALRDPYRIENTAKALERAGVVANGYRRLPDLAWTSKGKDS
jgi:hypothetical protein